MGNSCLKAKGMECDHLSQSIQNKISSKWALDLNLRMLIIKLFRQIIRVDLCGLGCNNSFLEDRALKHKQQKKSRSSSLYQNQKLLYHQENKKKVRLGAPAIPGSSGRRLAVILKPVYRREKREKKGREDPGRNKNGSGVRGTKGRGREEKRGNERRKEKLRKNELWNGREHL